MKNILFILLVFTPLFVFSQFEKNNHSTLQVDYIYGKIIKHKNVISHLAVSHPEGFILSWNKKATSENNDLVHYNYPDFGYSFIYHDFKNPILGKSYALQVNYSFYFRNHARKNQFYLKLGQGIAYVTDPFDLESNNKNNAFGSHLLANINFGFTIKEKVYLMPLMLISVYCCRITLTD